MLVYTHIISLDRLVEGKNSIEKHTYSLLRGSTTVHPFLSWVYGTTSGAETSENSSVQAGPVSFISSITANTIKCIIMVTIKLQYTS